MRHRGALPVVCGLAEDPVAQCRRAFVIYIQASAGYGSETANAMAARLCDLDLFVWLAALKWASGCSAADFADLCDRVAAGAGLSAHPEARGDFLARVYADLRQVQRTRLCRAIDIARRLRAGETPTTLRQTIPDEDSWVWDMLTQKLDRPATPRRPHQRGDQPGAKQS